MENGYCGTHKTRFWGRKIYRKIFFLSWFISPTISHRVLQTFNRLLFNNSQWNFQFFYRFCKILSANNILHCCISRFSDIKIVIVIAKKMKKSAIITRKYSVISLFQNCDFIFVWYICVETIYHRRWNYWYRFILR